MYPLTHKEKLLKKMFLILWSDNSPFSKHLWFLSFEIVQNIHKGATFQALTRLLPTKELGHPRRVSLIISKITHWIPKLENTNCHKTLVLSQCRRIWSMVSNSLHKAYLLTNVHPPFWSWSKVNTLPQQASQVKKLTVVRIHEFHTISKGKGIAQPVS